MRTDPTLTSDGNGAAVLTIYDVTDPWNWKSLRRIFWENGDDSEHQLRSNARAHAQEWRPEEGIISIAMYSPEDESIDIFVRHIGWVLTREDVTALGQQAVTN